MSRTNKRRKGLEHNSRTSKEDSAIVSTSSRRTTRSKAREIQQQYEEGQRAGLELNGNFLPDELMFCILGFLCNNNIHGLPCWSSNVAHLVSSFSLLSHDFQKCIQRYLQCTPLNLRYHFGTGHTMNQRIQMCIDEKVRFKSLRVDCSEPKIVQPFLARLAKNCNMNYLQDLSISFPCHDSNIEKLTILDHEEEMYSKQMQTCILEMTQTKIFMDRLEKLPIEIKIRVHDLELKRDTLLAFKDTVTSLELHISRMKEAREDNGFDNVSKFLEDVLPQMKQLKKLTLVHNQKFGVGFVSINSKSLQEIDVVKCDDGFYVKKMNCPKLKKFKYRHRLVRKDGEEIWTRNGVKKANIEFLTSNLQLCIGYETPNNCEWIQA